jgi:transposase-like protein
MDKLQGVAEAKKRVRLVLATLTGQISVADACKELGIGRTWFATLRRRVLQGAIDAAVEPLPVGRPQDEPPAVDVTALQREHEALQREHALVKAQLDVTVQLQGSRSKRRDPTRPAARRLRALGSDP